MNPLLQFKPPLLLHQEPKAMPATLSPVNAQGYQHIQPCRDQVQSNLIGRIDQAIDYLTSLTAIFVTLKNQVSALETCENREPNSLFAPKCLSEDNHDHYSNLKMTLATISSNDLEKQLHEVMETFTSLQKVSSNKASCDLDFTFERLHSTNDKESPKSDKSDARKKCMLTFPTDLQVDGFQEQINRASPVSQKDFSFFSKEDANLVIPNHEEQLESFGSDLKEMVDLLGQSQHAFQDVSAIVSLEDDNCSQELKDLLETLNTDTKREESRFSSFNNENGEKLNNVCDKDKDMSTDFSMEIQEIDLRPPKEPEGALPERILAVLDQDNSHSNNV